MEERPGKLNETLQGKRKEKNWTRVSSRSLLFYPCPTYVYYLKRVVNSMVGKVKTLFSPFIFASQKQALSRFYDHESCIRYSMRQVRSIHLFTYFHSYTFFHSFTSCRFQVNSRGSSAIANCSPWRLCYLSMIKTKVYRRKNIKKRGYNGWQTVCKTITSRCVRVNMIPQLPKTPPCMSRCHFCTFTWVFYWSSGSVMIFPFLFAPVSRRLSIIVTIYVVFFIFFRLGTYSSEQTQIAGSTKPLTAQRRRFLHRYYRYYRFHSRFLHQPLVIVLSHAWPDYQKEKYIYILKNQVFSHPLAFISFTESFRTTAMTTVRISKTLMYMKIYKYL